MQPDAPSSRLSCKVACTTTQQHGEDAPTWLGTQRIHQAVWRCPQPAMHQVISQHMEATGLHMVPCDLLVPAQQLAVGMLVAWRDVSDASSLPAHRMVKNMSQHSRWLLHCCGLGNHARNWPGVRYSVFVPARGVCYIAIAA